MRHVHRRNWSELVLTVALMASACSEQEQKGTTPLGNSATGGIGGSGGASAAGGGGVGGSAASGGAGGTMGGAAGTMGGAAGTAGLGGSGGSTGGSGGAAPAGTGGGGSGGMITSGGSGGDEPPPEECDPADRTPEATPLDGVGRGTAPDGMFDVVVETEDALENTTVFRPEPLGEIDHPVLAWGNGGCSRNNSFFTEFLIQLASHGIVVIADGTPGGSGSSEQSGEQLTEYLDWAEQENDRPCSKYYGAIALGKFAVAGQSCGGLMAINTSADERIATSMPMNSGLFARNTELYSMLHAPMAIIDGGESDIAYENGLADFEAIDTIPIVFANIPVGHGGTYGQDNGGEMGRFATAWVRWHLLGDEGATGKGMVAGADCGLCASEWDIQWKMEP